MDVAKLILRRAALSLAFAVAMYLFFSASWIPVLVVLVLGLVLPAALYRGRMSWGQAVAFLPEGGVHIVRRDGSTLDVAADAVQFAQVKADCLLVAWDEAGKRRSLVIGSESFAAATWAQVSAAAEALARAKPRPPSPNVGKSWRS